MDDPQIPDFFADGIGLAAGPFGFTISFHLSEPGTTPPDEVGRLVGRARISPELALQLALILQSAARDHGRDSGGTPPKTK